MNYYSVAAVELITSNLKTKHPGLAKVIKLPFASFEERISHAVHLSTDHTAGRDTVMIIAGVHGNEWGSCEIALNLAVDLLKAYEAGAGLAYCNKHFDAEQIKALLDERDVVIFPLVNPDGRHHSQTAIGDVQWRKNRNPAHSGGDPARVGVDINRNFDFLFDLAAFDAGAGVSSSEDTAYSTYQGPHPFSEAETKNVRWLFDQFPAVRWFVDLHCVGQVIRYVWSDDDAQAHTVSMNFRNPQHDGQRGVSAGGYGEFLATADETRLQALAQRFVDDVQAVHGTLYSAGPAFELTPYSGTSHDYAYSRHLRDSSQRKVLSFYIEWGTIDYQPLWSDMVPVIVEVSAGLIGFCLATR